MRRRSLLAWSPQHAARRRSCAAGHVTDEETTASFDAFVLKCYPPPAAPGADATDAAKEEYAVAKEKHAELLLTIDQQLLAYRRGDGVWGREKVMLAASRVSAVDYWDLYGTHGVELLELQRSASRCARSAVLPARAPQSAGTSSWRTRSPMTATGWRGAR